MTGKIIIGSDHRGCAMKAALKEFMQGLGMAVEDAGPFTDAPADYPEFAAKVACAVASGACGRGILICGSGIGMSVTANKFRGIRAALCHDVQTAEMCRLHNDANVLVMGASVGIEQACRMARIWLETPFEGGRHQDRLDMIAGLEKENFK